MRERDILRVCLVVLLCVTMFITTWLFNTHVASPPSPLSAASDLPVVLIDADDTVVYHIHHPDDDTVAYHIHHPASSPVNPVRQPVSEAPQPPSLQRVHIFMVLVDYVPDFLAHAIYNRLDIFANDERITIYHDCLVGNFSVENVDFVRIDFIALLRGIERAHNVDFSLDLRRNYASKEYVARVYRLRIADLARVFLCTANCFYIDVDVLLFRAPRTDLVVYEPVHSRSLNNGLFRLSGDNNDLLHDLRTFAFLVTAGDIARTDYPNNNMGALWRKHRDTLAMRQITVFEIPLSYFRTETSLLLKGRCDDLRFYATFGTFWHAYTKDHFRVMWDGYYGGVRGCNLRTSNATRLDALQTAIDTRRVPLPPSTMAKESFTLVK